VKLKRVEPEIPQERVKHELPESLRALAEEFNERVGFSSLVEIALYVGPGRAVPRRQWCLKMHVASALWFGTDLEKMIEAAKKHNCIFIKIDQHNAAHFTEAV